VNIRREWHSILGIKLIFQWDVSNEKKKIAIYFSKRGKCTVVHERI
jgi:hypothetical protein